MHTSPSEPEALLITGTVGAGKTSVAEAAGELLADAGTAHAVIDLDRLSEAWPAPADDPFNQRLELQNLTAVAGNYAEAGARRLVLAGVVASIADRSRYEEAVGMPLHICRLDVDLAIVRQRLAQRHAGQEPVLRWHLDRSAELDALLRAAAVEDFVLDVGRCSVLDVARQALSAVGWATGDALE